MKTQRADTLFVTLDPNNGDGDADGGPSLVTGTAVGVSILLLINRLEASGSAAVWYHFSIRSKQTKRSKQRCSPARTVYVEPSGPAAVVLGRGVNLWFAAGPVG